MYRNLHCFTWNANFDPVLQEHAFHVKHHTSGNRFHSSLVATKKLQWSAKRQRRSFRPGAMTRGFEKKPKSSTWNTTFRAFD